MVILQGGITAFLQRSNDSNEVWCRHFQFTAIDQAHPSFKAGYSGNNSLINQAEKKALHYGYLICRQAALEKCRSVWQRGDSRRLGNQFGEGRCGLSKPGNFSHWRRGSWIMVLKSSLKCFTRQDLPPFFMPRRITSLCCTRSITRIEDRYMFLPSRACIFLNQYRHWIKYYFRLQQ